MQFRSARREARAAVRFAQITRFESIALEAERRRFDGACVWQGIWSLQWASKGLVPITIHAINDENGQVCTTLDSQHQRWCRHFSAVLNIPSQITVPVLESLPQRPVHEDLGLQPSLAEVQKAIAQLKNRKAAGLSTIIQELLKAGGLVFANALLVLLDSVREEERVPQAWVDSLLLT